MYLELKHHHAVLPKLEEITMYKQGNWMDLCRGPHLPSTKHVGKSFKLMKVAGASTVLIMGVFLSFFWIRERVV